MKRKIIIIETDEGIDIEQFFKEDWGKTWEPILEGGDTPHIDSRNLHRLFHEATRKVKIDHIQTRRNKP